LLESVGNCQEVISLGAEVRNVLRELDNDHLKLGALWRRQHLSQKANLKKDCDKNFDHLELLSQMIAETRNSFVGGKDCDDTIESITNLTGLRAQLLSRKLDPEFAVRMHQTAEEAAALSRWTERDAEIDKAVGDIGLHVDQLGKIGVAIGQAADKQKDASSPIAVAAETAHNDMNIVSLKLKELLVKKKKGVFCCRLILSAVVVVCIGVVVFQLSSLGGVKPLIDGWREPSLAENNNTDLPVKLEVDDDVKEGNIRGEHYDVTTTTTTTPQD